MAGHDAPWKTQDIEDAMAMFRIAGVLIGLMLLAGCADHGTLKMADGVNLSGPCAPNYVSLALQF
jgi:hypothetical protein